MFTKEEVSVILYAFDVAEHESVLATNIASDIVKKLEKLYPEIINENNLHWMIKNDQSK